MVQSDSDSAFLVENFLTKSIKMFDFFGRFENQTGSGNVGKIVNLIKFKYKVGLRAVKHLLMFMFKHV
jgi:hypothetical protein